MQNIARRGDILVTFDAKKEPELALRVLGGEELAKRCSRVSAAFSPRTDTYPFNPGEALTTAVVEGDYPTFLVHIALGHDASFAKEGDHFVRDGAKVGSLSTNILLYTDDDWNLRKQAFLLPPTVDDVTAGELAMSSIGIYVDHPVTFFDLGWDVPKTVFPMIERMVVLIDGEKNANITINVADETKAATLSKMLRSAYVAELRRSKTAFSVQELKNMFTLEGNLLTITGIHITDSQFSGMLERLGSLV
jgi:hypothetical protein